MSAHDAWPDAAAHREFLSAIIDHVGEPVFVKDRQFRFVLVNPAFARLADTTPEALLGRTDYDFFPQDESDFFRRKDEEVFATGREVRIDEESLTASHGRRLLTTRKVPLRDPATGEVTHLVGIIHDITRVKQAEERLRQLNDDLERRVAERTEALAAAHEVLVRNERLAVLGQVAGGLAHQVRNPLGVIANAAQLLERTAAFVDPAVAGPVEMILEEVWRANRTITGLLDFARVRPPRAFPEDVAAIVHRALAGQLVPDGIEVVEDLPELPAVEVDAEQVQQAIGNLLHNAIDAMPSGGRLVLAARLEAGAVMIAVEDSGVGIAPEVQPRLFQPLVTTKASGVGLGLTTARRLIEDQGGTLGVTSRVGEGSRFEIRLPCGARGWDDLEALADGDAELRGDGVGADHREAPPPARPAARGRR